MAEIVRGQSPGHKDTLSTLTLHQLLGRMKDGTFRPGQKLPSQNDLVEQFGVSRTGIREAMQMLAALNLIEIRAGLGCFVKSVSPEYVINAEVLSILLEKEALYEVIETRKIVESGIAALAAQRAKTEDFWRMEDVLTQMDRRIQCNESVAGIAAEFHYALALGSQNTVLTKLVYSFIQLMTKAGLLLESNLETDMQALSAFRQHELQSHRDLYLAIKGGDPAKASQAMVDHISHSQGLIVHTIGSVENLPLAESAPELAGKAV